MSTRLKVIKVDGSIEDYLHTKVIGCVNNALALTGQENMFVAEQLAEAVTSFLYRGRQVGRVTSGEIFSMVQIVLETTLYEDAAVALVEYHHKRNLRRRRIEVVDVKICNISDAAMFGQIGGAPPGYLWNKFRIVEYLTTKYDIARQTARVIASMVEEKVLNIGITRISRSLIKQIVLADAALVLRAGQQLEAVVQNSHWNENPAETEVCLRQQQEGLCVVEAE